MGTFSPDLGAALRGIGLGGGGLVLGSVGLSFEVGRGILLATGGVIGRGIRRGGGGEGLGGRGREVVGFGGGSFLTALDADGRGEGEKLRDLKTAELQLFQELGHL